MIQTQVTVIDKALIAPAWWELTLAAPDLKPLLQAGQFLLVRCDTPWSCYLRRPIFPRAEADGRMSLLLRPDPDPGLAWLAARQPGEPLDGIGPLGSGFSLASEPHNLLLISDSQLLSPLLSLIEPALEADHSVTLALGASRAQALYPISRLPPAVEFQAATLDGSFGRRGAVTRLLPDLLRWADQVCAVGSFRLYQAIKAEAGQVRFAAPGGFAYGLLSDLPLACGVGACLACAVETSAGIKLSCSDGPVFDLADLML
jgi:dihydroorotate dehydrogenase electron transfer subunit